MRAEIDELERRGLRVEREAPMEKHTSFRIGGPAAAIVFPRNEGELEQAARLLREAGITPLLVGNGTNLLVTDGPLRRIVIKTHDGLSRLEQMGKRVIYAGSGALLSRTAAFARDAGLTGLEFAHGIPGTVGGGVSMNAGAYRGDMKGVVRTVHYLDEKLNRCTAKGEEIGFDYRRSRFSDTGDIILGAEIKLTKGDPEEIQARMEELSDKRRNSQPLNYPSAGSAFKRPDRGFAAAMIEKSGLKGYTVGGAQVSEKHAGFVINRGDATFADVLLVIEHVQQVVKRKWGVDLVPEIKIIR